MKYYVLVPLRRGAIRHYTGRERASYYPTTAPTTSCHSDTILLQGAVA